MVFTQTGIKELILWLSGESSTAPTHIATGVGTDYESDEDTALGNEKTRPSLTVVSYNDSEVTFQILLTSAMANGNSLTEAGVFNASASGDMFNRFTHGAVVKTSNVEVEYLITFQLANSDII